MHFYCAENERWISAQRRRYIVCRSVVECKVPCRMMGSTPPVSRLTKVLGNRDSAIVRTLSQQAVMTLTGMDASRKMYQLLVR